MTSTKQLLMPRWGRPKRPVDVGHAAGDIALKGGRYVKKWEINKRNPFIANI